MTSPPISGVILLRSESCTNERVKNNVGLNTAFGRIKPEPLPGRQGTINDEPNKPGRQLSF